MFSIKYLYCNREFELSNHLGNVQVTISDKRIRIPNPSNPQQTAYYLPEVLTTTDYYPFGMQMPARTFSATAGVTYRFGFNDKMNDNEVTGWQDYGMREYDTRIARFVSVDPLTKDYPELTPYQFASNTPIWALDIDGLEGWPLSGTNNGTQEGFQLHINSIFKAYLNNPSSIDIQTDCAKFQFYLMAKYYESTGQRLIFKGKDGKVYDSHAQDTKGNYVYNGFNSFFYSAKQGITTQFLINGGNGLTRKKEGSEPLSSGDMFINWFETIGHAEGLVVEGDKKFKFYGSGYDTYKGNCPDCKTDFYGTLEDLQSAKNRYSWSFLDKLPVHQEREEIPKMTPLSPNGQIDLSDPKYQLNQE